MIASLASLVTSVCPAPGASLPADVRIEISARRARVVVQGSEHGVLRVLTPASEVSCRMLGNVLRLVVSDSARALTVQMPVTHMVTVTAFQGDIDVLGVHSAVFAYGGAGSVRIVGARGTVLVRTTAGIELEDIAGSIVATGHHDAVRLMHTRGDVRVSNERGMINLDDVEAVNLSATTGTGDVRCTCRTAGAGTWELRAGAGDVTVSVQRGAALVAALEAMPNAAHWRLAGSTVHRTDSRRVTVARGQNGTRIILSSGSGAVTVSERDR